MQQSSLEKHLHQGNRTSNIHKRSHLEFTAWLEIGYNWHSFPNLGKIINT